MPQLALLDFHHQTAVAHYWWIIFAIVILIYVLPQLHIVFKVRKLYDLELYDLALKSFVKICNAKIKLTTHIHIITLLSLKYLNIFK